MYTPDPPRVTVLIDTYNYARFVGRAIESVLQQVYLGPPIQILVIDDGSDDDTVGVVAQYADAVTFINKDNGGQASSLNLGFRQAAGDVICLLDGDDYFYPGKVQQVADEFRRRPEVGLVYNQFELVDRSGTPLGKVYPETTWTGCKISASRVPAQLKALIRLGHPWTCVTSAISIRRSVAAQLTIPEDIFPHSPDLFLGLVLPFLTDVSIVETPSTAYVFHGENVGLFRSSATNRAIHARQMEYIRSYLEESVGVHFLDYFGRSIYGPGKEPPVGHARLQAYIDQLREIVSAGVEPAIAWRSQVKLTAGFLIPEMLYAPLRELRSRQRAWRGRQFQQKIAEARR
jgi:glycosyltransferase involved in cell wall biosynthesis